MKRILPFVVAMLVAIPMFAADLGIHKDWADSPQGWFMTKTERAQWATLTSEAEATKFIADFLAKRHPKFAEEIKTRAQKADQYFSVGDTAGSEALRGKVVILLGPPSSMDVTAKKARSGGRTGSLDSAVSAGSERTGAGLADVAEVDQRDAMGTSPATVDKLYTITYGAEQLPTKKGISVVIEVNAVSGKDKIKDKRALAELEKVFEAIAEASVQQ
ncbi:MAG: GWxTD domain-containing protein [Thermoanaerobaculia bacterium]